jgi:hypothetical protein
MPSYLLLLTILTAGYLASCLFWPNRLCPRCAGTGRLVNASRTAARICAYCDGVGMYPRLGRRLLTAARRHRRNRRNRY